MINAIKNILLAIVVGAVALFFYAKDQNEKREKLRAAEYAAERAWKDPLVNNCKNAVRAMADSGTLRFGGGLFGHDKEKVDKTDSGYLYFIRASDATTGNTPITILCYTNQQGQVVRVVPKGS